MFDSRAFFKPGDLSLETRVLRSPVSQEPDGTDRKKSNRDRTGLKYYLLDLVWTGPK